MIYKINAEAGRNWEKQGCVFISWCWKTFCLFALSGNQNRVNFFFFFLFIVKKKQNNHQALKQQWVWLAWKTLGGHLARWMLMMMGHTGTTFTELVVYEYLYFSTHWYQYLIRPLHIIELLCVWFSIAVMLFQEYFSTRFSKTWLTLNMLLRNLLQSNLLL